MRDLVKLLLNSSVTRFLAVGVANTIVGLSVIFASAHWLQMRDWAANMVGYVVALAFSFMCNRKWTFRHQGDARRSFGRFITVFLIAYGLNLLALYLAALMWPAPSFLPQIVAMVVYTIAFYVGSKLFAFAR